MGIQVTVSPNGRVVIPADVRRKLGIENGGTLTLSVDEYGVTLSTAKQRVRKAQALYRQFTKGKSTGSVDDFLEEKRRDAAKENEDLARGYR